MAQETTNVMTTYEIIATVIAILALLQPWMIKLWDRFCRRICVNFIPSSKIKLYYNRSGAYVYLGGVIEAKNKAAVVKDIAVKVVRKKDKAELLLDWSSFMIPVFQSVGGNAVTTSEIARPFKVEADSLYPVFVEFASTNIQESNRLTEIYNTMAFELAGIMWPNITIDQAKYALAALSNYRTFRDELLQNFYWRADDYVIELTIMYNNTKTQRYKFKFSIDVSEADSLKGNIEKSLQSVVDEIYRVTTNFCYLQKDFVLDDGE